MKDMTQGSVTSHLLHMASFLALSMVVQTLYLLADLYWVGRLGKEAIAAVGVAANVMMVVVALSQALSVGATTVIAQAIGRKDQPAAERAFNQALVLSLAVGVGFGAVMFALLPWYTSSLSADASTAKLAREYLHWYIPALMMQFTLAALGAALRATGIIRPAAGLQVVTVVLNATVAPFLIFGVGPFPKMGVSGAAAATFISVLVGNLLFVWYYHRYFHYVRVRTALLPPNLSLWWKMLAIGIPAGAEFALLSVYMAIVYTIIRPFGSAAQAGFGIGGRITQSLFLPVLALSFAVAPVVGQNFGGRQPTRVRETFRSALSMSVGLMALLTLVSQLTGGAMIRLFSKDPAVVEFGREYLRIISFNFVAVGITFTSSSVFQGIGNTVPPLVSSSMRLVLFALPAILLSRMPGFQIVHVWYLSVASVFIQAVVNLLLLQREMRVKLSFSAPIPAGGATAGVGSVS